MRTHLFPFPAHRLIRLTLALCVLAAAGCAGRRQAVRAQGPECPTRGVILVVDGAGGFEATSHAVQDVVTEDNIPLRVETFAWSHGYARAIADHLDEAHALNESKWLANRLTELTRCECRQEIHLIGHSAGCYVTVSGMAYLPPDSVDRIILLAPAISADYNLRPALRSARRGIDVFYSERDRFFLGAATSVLGTSDRRWDSPASGRVGFHPPIGCPEDPLLMARLHQHPWDPSQRWAGHRGGHYGSYDRKYLRAYVLPLLLEQ